MRLSHSASQLVLCMFLCLLRNMHEEEEENEEKEEQLGLAWKLR